MWSGLPRQHRNTLLKWKIAILIPEAEGRPGGSGCLKVVKPHSLPACSSIKSMTSPPHLYVYSDTLIFPFSPVVSVLLVRLTVFPKRQYRGIRCPMTPVTTSPVWIPIVIWRRQSWTSVALVVNMCCFTDYFKCPHATSLWEVKIVCPKRKALR